MTYSISIDFRRQVLAVRERDHLSIAQVAERFAVGKASVMRWLARTERKPSGFRQRKLDIEALKQDLRDYPDAYQYERATRLGVSYKKNTRASARGRSRTVCLSSTTGRVRSGRAAVGMD